MLEIAMRQLSPVFVAALMQIGLFCPYAALAERLDGPVPGTVEKVTDGDTFLIKAKIWLGQELVVKVRLADVDTPELTRPKCEAERDLAKRAKVFAANRLLGRGVLLHDIRHGKYAGRVVAKITTAEGDLGEHLLNAGLARSYKDKATSWCPTS